MRRLVSLICGGTLAATAVLGIGACKDHEGGGVAFHCQQARSALQEVIGGTVTTVALGRHVLPNDEKDWCLFRHRLGETYSTVQWSNHATTFDHHF